MDLPVAFVRPYSHDRLICASKHADVVRILDGYHHDHVC